jgi:F-type H+-transporting ATPase subunit b
LNKTAKSHQKPKNPSQAESQVVSVAIDWTLIAQLITFVILMVILNKILYKPILAILKERETMCDNLKNKAANSKELLEKGEKEEKDARGESLSQGAALQGKLRDEGRKQETDILKKAQDEASEKIEAARKGLQADVEAAKGDLAKEAKLIAQEMASKILGRDLAVS